MSDQAFVDVFAEFSVKVKLYDDPKRAEILQGVKDAFAAIQAKAGEPVSAEMKAAIAAKAEADAKAEMQAKAEATAKVEAQAKADAAAAALAAARKVGGPSSISFGSDASSTETSKPLHTSTKVHYAPGGKTSNIFGDEPVQTRSSTLTHFAPGGKTSISFGGDSAPDTTTKADTKTEAKVEVKVEVKAEAVVGAVASTTVVVEVSSEQRKEISIAVYGKGKLKDTFSKFNGNRSKTLTAEDLLSGVASVGITISAAQAAHLITKFASNPKEGLTYSDFVKLLQL